MNSVINVLLWFRGQFNEVNVLKNVTFQLCDYMNKNKLPNVLHGDLHNFMKIIRQDINKIQLSVFRMNDLKMSENDKGEGYFTEEGIRKTSDYLGMDIEYFFIKYRAIIDYSVYILVEFFPELKNRNKYNLEDKMNYLHDIFGEDHHFAKSILSSKWYDQLRSIRNSIVHQGASCLIFTERQSNEILFQVYNKELDQLLFGDDYYKHNENVYSFNKIYVVHMGYLFLYLDSLFKAIISKKENIDFDDVDKYYYFDESLFGKHFKDSQYRNRYSDVLLKWLDDFLNDVTNLEYFV